MSNNIKLNAAGQPTARGLYDPKLEHDACGIGFIANINGNQKHSIVKNESKGMHFAEANFASLMIAMSQGDGEFLSGFSEVLGCSNADTTFKRVLRKNPQTQVITCFKRKNLYNGIMISINII